MFSTTMFHKVQDIGVRDNVPNCEPLGLTQDGVSETLSMSVVMY